MDITSSYTMSDCARFKAERDALAQRMEEIASEIDRTLSGVEGIEDAPALRWMRGLREALGSLHSPRIGYEDIEAARWVREHGGLEHLKNSLSAFEMFAEGVEIDMGLELYGESPKERCVALRNEVRSRLMPEGMEWPRYEDGGPVMFGDCVENRRGTCTVNSIRFYIGGGVTVYGEDSGAQFVVVTEPVMRESIKRAKHQVLAADDKPLRERETVWGVDSGTRYTVEKITDELIPIKCRSEMGSTVSLHPSQLTHERPDSWQLIERDATSYGAAAYCDEYPDAKEIKTDLTMWDRKAIHLVRRAKALTGVSE